PGWATLAGYVALQARWQDGRLGAAQLGRVRALAIALEDAGWANPALDARLVAARVALDLGRLAEGRRELRVAARARARGPGALRGRRVRPPDSPAVGEMLGELRRVTGRLESAALEGDDTRALLQQQAALERSIRDQVRHTREAAPPGGGDPPCIAEIRVALG